MPKYAPDSYEAFMQQAEADELERLELLELERRCRVRNESWQTEQSKKSRERDGGTKAWLIGNGLSK